MAEGRVGGVDGGGTYTHAMVADGEGHVLALVEAGESHLDHQPHGQENARAAMQGARVSSPGALTG